MGKCMHPHTLFIQASCHSAIFNNKYYSWILIILNYMSKSTLRKHKTLNSVCATSFDVAQTLFQCLYAAEARSAHSFCSWSESPITMWWRHISFISCCLIKGANYPWLILSGLLLPPCLPADFGGRPPLPLAGDPPLRQPLLQHLDSLGGTAL